MRPEYLKAVESAKFGSHLIALLVIPIAIILLAFLVNRFQIKNLSAQNRTLVLLAATALAYIVFIALAARYANNIQHVKQITMQTEQEIADCSADSPFALLMAFPAGLIVCGSTFIEGLIGTGLSRIEMKELRKPQAGGDEMDDDLGRSHENPYASK